MQKLLVIIGICLLSVGCSNPFSSQNPRVLQENPRPSNLNCNDIRFDQGTVTTQQFRSVLRCLNQKNELSEIQLWADSVTDEELQPWVERYNSILEKDPAFLYALKEFYINSRNSGELQNLLNQILKKMLPDQNRRGFLGLIQKHSTWIRDFFSNPNYKINTGNLALLPEVLSFQRGVQEQFQTQNLKRILIAIEKYRRQKDSFTFEELYSFFGKSDSAIFSEPGSSEKIASFLNWLVADGRLEQFSTTTELLLSRPIDCFNAQHPIANSLPALIQQLQEMKPEQLPEFLQKNLSAVLLIGRGYCAIPDQVIDTAKLLISTTEQDSLVPFFRFLQPLLHDKKFLPLLASSSFRNLAKDLADINGTHLFQDTVTLIEWFKKNPVSETNTAALMDSIFDEFTVDEMWSFFQLIPEDREVFKTLYRFQKSLPELHHSTSTKGNWLTPFTKNSLLPVIDLIAKMNREQQIFPIIDRVIELFKDMLERGKKDYLAPQLALPEHSEQSNSQDWVLSKSTPTSSKPLNSSCSRIPLEFRFFDFGNEIPVELFLHNLDKLSECFGANQSFNSLKNFAEFLLNRDPTGLRFKQFNQLQKDALNFIFALDSNQALSSFEQLIHLDAVDLKHVGTWLKSAPPIIKAVKTPLRTSTAIRNLIAKYSSTKETYAAFTEESPESLEWAPGVIEIHAKLSKVVFDALPEIFAEYCASKNINSSDCDVDPDQVELYQKSPKTLAEKIAWEYLDSSQSWAHPLEFGSWKKGGGVKDVGFLNYHLDPLLKQLDENPKALISVFNFMGRNQRSPLAISDFIAQKSKSIKVIPYIFQDPRYPYTYKEYHHLARIRIVNDIDRLELLAINADFKPFGKMKNFGMEFIREIATSWGDVPAGNRPPNGTSETLNQARASILSQFNTFNRGILEKIGSCDPRGRNRLGQWFQNRFCKGELSDIRARMFNLNAMLSILDDPETLILLRDLFYSLYENNSKDQEGVYTDGVRGIDTDQKVDLLEMIPKIARLGLLHQAGLSVMKDRAKATNAILDVLNQSHFQNRAGQLSEILVTTDGQRFIRNLLDFAMSLSENQDELNSTATLLQQISRLKNQEWLVFLAKLGVKKPDLLTEFAPTLREALRQISPGALTSRQLNLFSSISADLQDPRLVDETIALLKPLTGFQSSFVKLFSEKPSKDLIHGWLVVLADEKNQTGRDQIASFIRGNRFDEFCDVFSDSSIVEKTYNFLEQSNQNSGVSELLQQCRRFLH